MQHLHVDGVKGRFYLSHKALFAAESYVFARYHMYRTVYFHKTTRAAEVMLRLLLRRYRRLLSEANSSAQTALVPDAPPAVVRAFSGPIALDQYLALDDHSMTEFAKACSSSSDGALAELAAGLLHRRLFKATDVTQVLAPAIVDFTVKAKEIISTAGYDVEFAFEHDAPSDTAYKLYNPDVEKPATQIYVDMPGAGRVELSTCSESVQEISRKYTLVRYYYPPAVRGEIRAAAEPLLKKE